MPGGPWRQRMGPFMSPRIFCTARNSSIRFLTLSRPQWSSSIIERACCRLKRSWVLLLHGRDASNSRYVWMLVYSACWGLMLFRRLSSRFAIFCASSGRPPCASFSPKRFASSASSSESSPLATSQPSSSSPSSPLPLPLLRTRWRSFCTSWICRPSTTCRNSSSRDLCRLLLISPETRLASASRCKRSRTSSRRSLRSSVSRIRCRSSTESCGSAPPTTLASADGDSGHRMRRALPLPSWPLCMKAVIFSCTLLTSARTLTSVSASGASSRRRTAATRKAPGAARA
mmetsp:Transcript_47864/g.126361  ORF Transcript_47864/g.126361 Transcript_47864/m.126361 type:complete len:287 (-) Transcript_47864:63-923(-)